MDSCLNLFLLSSITYKLSEFFNEDELSILAANLTALGDMLQVVIAHKDINNNSNQS